MNLHILRLLNKILIKRKLVICKSLVYSKRRQNSYLYQELNSDYIRIAQLEHCANEIEQKKLIGSIAELGVYQGDFAKFMNTFFPDRHLYLFDTFEGFNSKDIEIDQKRKFSSLKKVQNFSDTNEKLVLSKMSFPQQCILKKGYFPESVGEENEIYVFVSIDVDLYRPVYEGLKYFWSHLAKGGYLFVHDYTNDEYKGAREAVLQFSKEEDISFLPMIDICGSAVFVK